MGANTLDKRKALFDGDQSIKEEGLALLAATKNPRQGKWFILEGETVVDCVLEFENATVYVEGKRTEPNLTSSTSWYQGRKQVLRNLDCLLHAPNRPANWFVLLAVEEGTKPEQEANALDLASEEVLRESMPHLNSGQLAKAWEHYLGFATWAMIGKRFGLPPFPDTTRDLGAARQDEGHRS